MTLTRRAFVATGLCGIAASRFAHAAAVDGLQSRAARTGRIFGAAVMRDDLVYRPGWADRVAEDVGLIVPEYELKWRPLAATEGQYDFAKADWLYEFARDRGLAVRGSALVWGKEDTPQWVPRNLSRSDAERLIRAHIAAVAGRYAGRTQSWDVVNEAIEIGDPDDLRRTAWSGALGFDYVALSFRAAAEADPAAKLYYNDFHLESAVPAQDQRRRATLDLLKRLRDGGVPIHGLGIQSHLAPGALPFDADRFGRFLDDVAALDLDILLSEIDVDDRRVADQSVAGRDAASADAVYRLLACAFRQPRVVGAVTWGLSDYHSWLNDDANMKRADGSPHRPLPLDKDLVRKPIWHAIARAFDEAPPRG